MTTRDIAMSAAGSATDKTYIEDVFSTYLLPTGDGTTPFSVNNGINLSTYGGLVWTKTRAFTNDHYLFTTDLGRAYSLSSNLTAQQVGPSGSTQDLTSFNTDGFSVGANYVTLLNGTGRNVSWTFRKAPKFFDVVTYTGTGVAGKQVSHSLGQVPGMVIIKRTDSTSNWTVYHSSLGQISSVFLNTTASFISTAAWNSLSPTSTVIELGSDASVNASGGTYVAYFFGNDTTTDGLVQTESYLGNGSTTGPIINLGWEPQYVMIKRVTGGTGSWQVFDNTRGVVITQTAGQNDASLVANTTAAETISTDYIDFTSTGFQLKTALSDVNASGSDYIYMAIRRGPMRTPTDGTKVFQPVAYTGTNVDNRLVDTGIFTDLVMARQRTATTTGFWFADRLRGNYFLQSTSTAAEATDADSFMTPTTSYGNSFSAMNGFGVGNDATRLLNQSSTNQLAYAFKRAPGFFDMANYSNANQVAHNLKVVPELIIACTKATTNPWQVFYKGNNNNAWRMRLSLADPASDDAWPFSTGFTASYIDTAYTGNNLYYLFASCPGVSKVGTYTGTGTTNSINCGFTAGARFVLIKRTDSTGDWYVWDTARGLIAGNDPYLLLNSTAAEVTNTDYIDPYSAGFELSSTAPAALNASGGTYLYLAIA